jgi:hypothetical protein
LRGGFARAVGRAADRFLTHRQSRRRPDTRHGANPTAPGHLRRKWQALVVYDERTTDAEVAELFATLASPIRGLPDRLGREDITGTAAFLAWFK